MIYFKASEVQIRKMAANAFNASLPSPGRDTIKYNPKKVLSERNFSLEPGTKIFRLTYCEGRQVKLQVWKHTKELWSMYEPDLEYQTWINTYPTAKDLIESVGAKVFEFVDREKLNNIIFKGNKNVKAGHSKKDNRKRAKVFK